MVEDEEVEQRLLQHLKDEIPQNIPTSSDGFQVVVRSKSKTARRKFHQ